MDLTNIGPREVTWASKHALGFYTDIFMLSTNRVSHLAVFSFEIVSVWKFDTFRQTHRTTEANFTCPLGHQTSIFTSPKSKLTCPGQWHLGLSCPVTRTVSTLTVFFIFKLQHSALSCQSKSDENTYYLSCQTPS